jgi:hypothetical protein
MAPKGIPMTDKSIRRFISKFRRDNEKRAGEIDVNHIPLATLRTIFNEPMQDDELLVFVYDINEDHARALQPFVQEPFDLKTCDYFLEAESLT